MGIVCGCFTVAELSRPKWYLYELISCLSRHHSCPYKLSFLAEIGNTRCRFSFYFRLSHNDTMSSKFSDSAKWLLFYFSVSIIRVFVLPVLVIVTTLCMSIYGHCLRPLYTWSTMSRQFSINFYVMGCVRSKGHVFVFGVYLLSFSCCQNQNRHQLLPF